MLSFRKLLQEAVTAGVIAMRTKSPCSCICESPSTGQEASVLCLMNEWICSVCARVRVSACACVHTRMHASPPQLALSCASSLCSLTALRGMSSPPEWFVWKNLGQTDQLCPLPIVHLCTQHLWERAGKSAEFWSSASNWYHSYILHY